MKNVFAIISAVAIFALSGAVIASLPSEGSLGLFAIGILVAIFIVNKLVFIYVIYKYVKNNLRGAYKGIAIFCR